MTKIQLRILKITIIEVLYVYLSKKVFTRNWFKLKFCNMINLANDTIYEL